MDTIAQDVDGFKLWYSGGGSSRYGVDTLVDRELRELVVDVRRVNDRLMCIKQVVGGWNVHVISAYAPQVGLDEEVKRNKGGTSLLDFAKAFALVIANSCFHKREEHLVTFHSMVAKTQIDYLLLIKCDIGLCSDYKVIPSENIVAQHRHLVMDFGD
ncbi:PREDICTED: uncharacterized protein LOC109217727 [Nicotiana attenuata]|uniref:uncharacterized protein LOC109217727 n=1 Tax=Nicotiana attenuata TaxID=49451 RepID=UPI0009056E9D|nr:PREDICTED: uncharacterized protein LOC109217727 [Nicotiana attenuata]